MTRISRKRKRSERAKGQSGPGGGGHADTPTMMLTNLMDIFIVLILYLLVNQSQGIVLTPPDGVKLPDSGVDTLPRQSIVIELSTDEVEIMGEPVVPMADVVSSQQPEIPAIREAIERIKEDSAKKNQLGVSTEVTIVADRSVPFKVLKKVMLSSSNAGYGKISFAVNQK